MIAALAPYLGLFGSAFLSATLLPGQSELLLTAMLLSERYDPALLLAAATAGNSLGALANWLLGVFFERFRERRWFPFKADAIDKGARWYARWGKWSLLLSWAPVVGDVLTFAAGLLRTPLTVFLPLVIVAKAGRYLVVMLLVSGLA